MYFLSNCQSVCTCSKIIYHTSFLYVISCCTYSCLTSMFYHFIDWLSNNCLIFFSAYTPDVTIAPPLPKEQCQQPSDYGTGQGQEVMYYYDPTIGDCRPFWYSGAGGNDNRFMNSTRCRMVCRRDTVIVPVVTPVPVTTPQPLPTPDPGTDVIITGKI